MPSDPLPTVGPDPAVAPKRIDSLYEALKAMQVDLDADPLELGPKRLNEKIAACRGMLSRCEKIFLDVSQSLHYYKRELRRATADFKLAIRELLTNDPEVRAGRNVTDREAIATTKLRNEAEDIDRLTSCVEELEAVLMVIRTKRTDLKDTQGRLRDQLKVCQEEIGLGSHWGRSMPPRHKAEEDPAQASVNDLMNQVLGPEALPGVEDITPPSEASTEDPAIPPDRTLEAIPEDLPIPEVKHPDDQVFTDTGIDELLSDL